LSVDGTLGHLPQNLPLNGDLTVAEVLGVDAVVRALAAVESGDVSEEHFTVIGNDWDIEERRRAQLDRLGLAGLALDRSLSTLSGGQVVSLGLAAQLLKRPDVLLLDEPGRVRSRSRAPPPPQGVLVDGARQHRPLDARRRVVVPVDHLVDQTGVAGWTR
jgi:hypothetical protein